MSSPSARRRVAVTNRDVDLFRGLAHSPLTAEQIFKLSGTFSEPFPSLHRVQVRLGQLATAGLLRAWRYATRGQGSAPHYYKLSPDAYRLVFGEHALLPTKRFLDEVKLPQHEHKRLLADFTVHTHVVAHRHGLSFVYFHPENTHRIETGEGTVFPDQAFGLQRSSTLIFNYFVEVDNSTEPVRSKARLDAWEQRLRVYYRNERESYERSKLLIVCTKHGSRLPHLLKLARDLNPDPSYSFVAGITLSEYLAQDDPFFSGCFRNQHNKPLPLLRTFAPAPLPVVSSAPARQASALTV